MCGITVSVALRRTRAFPLVNKKATNETNNKSNGTSPVLEEQLSKSLDLIKHRGPDSKGIWISRDGAVGLGHNRLSINDLSPSGDQPLHSDDGKIHAVINGEIYDHDRLRQVCINEYGYRFKGHSDSEVALALYKHYGAPEFLNHLRGEFSLVIYDETCGKVIAARDRFGIKPLFWTIVGEGEDRRILFAAEAKAFLALGWQPEWDVGSLVEEGWQHDTRTLFKGVQKVMPGHWMEVSPSGEIQHQQYWDLDYRDKTEVETRTQEEMIEGVRERLNEAIRLRLRADVPVGIYLSGGIDSSLLAGIVTHLIRDEGVKMGNQDATKRVACFSIEFPHESGFDESDIAERTAKWLGVQIMKTRVDEEALAAGFSDSAYHCEHHNFDLNSVGKFILSKLPRDNGFKVVLTGEGADEHFAGYPFFPSDFLREPDHSMPNLPLAKDKALCEALWKNTQSSLEEAQKKNMKVDVAKAQSGTSKSQALENDIPMEKMPSFVQAWQSILLMFSPWVRENWATSDCRASVTRALTPDARKKIMQKWHPLHSSEYVWCKCLLPNSLLACLGDRTEMAHSIEARPPFLDHVLSEYVNGLPPSLKVAYTPERASLPQNTEQSKWYEGLETIRDMFTEKWVLREAGKPYLTKELYERKKHPYTAPSKWPVGGPLHKVMQGLCTKEKVEDLGFVDWNVAQYSLMTAFGDNANPMSFRALLFIASWVTMSERMGIKKASIEDWKAQCGVKNGDSIAQRLGSLQV